MSADDAGRSLTEFRAYPWPHASSPLLILLAAAHFERTAPLTSLPAPLQRAALSILSRLIHAPNGRNRAVNASLKVPSSRRSEIPLWCAESPSHDYRDRHRRLDSVS